MRALTMGQCSTERSFPGPTHASHASLHDRKQLSCKVYNQLAHTAEISTAVCVYVPSCYLGVSAYAHASSHSDVRIHAHTGHPFMHPCASSCCCMPCILQYVNQDKTGFIRKILCRSAAVLALGDAVAISAFAIIGRVSHGEPINADAFLTAAPFLAGVLPSRAYAHSHHQSPAAYNRAHTCVQPYACRHRHIQYSKLVSTYCISRCMPHTPASLHAHAHSCGSRRCPAHSSFSQAGSLQRLS